MTFKPGICLANLVNQSPSLSLQLMSRNKQLQNEVHLMSIRGEETDSINANFLPPFPAEGYGAHTCTGILSCMLPAMQLKVKSVNLAISLPKQERGILQMFSQHHLPAAASSLITSQETSLGCEQS